MPKRILEVRHHEYDCVSTLSFEFIKDTMLAYVYPWIMVFLMWSEGFIG